MNTINVCQLRIYVLHHTSSWTYLHISLSRAEKNCMTASRQREHLVKTSRPGWEGFNAMLLRLATFKTVGVVQNLQTLTHSTGSRCRGKSSCALLSILMEQTLSPSFPSPFFNFDGLITCRGHLTPTWESQWVMARSVCPDQRTVALTVNHCKLADKPYECTSNKNIEVLNLVCWGISDCTQVWNDTADRRRVSSTNTQSCGCQYLSYKVPFIII